MIHNFRAHTIGLKRFPAEIQRYAKKVIKEYVIHHLNVFDLCMKMENEFTVLVLLQFISSAGMICFILYQIYDVSCVWFAMINLHNKPFLVSARWQRIYE